MKSIRRSIPVKRSIISVAICCTWLLATSRGQSTPVAEPDDAIVWLQALLVEARAGLQLIDGYDQPRLFSETGSGGSTWMESITAELASDWALVDQGVTLLLDEADQMREMAEAAVPADEAKFVAARKLYLEEAAALLAVLRDAARTAHDDTVGVAPGIAGLPDWLLPGEVELHKVAGGGKLNVANGEFGGHLSGEVGLPKFDATFVVPNASFDSRGNVDLAAYGQASFPPGAAEKVNFSVPARRPLTFHLSEAGDVRVAGAGKVTLPDGNQFGAYFDVDDPEYQLGFSFAGGLTLDLAKEISLLRPVINYDINDPLTFEAIDGVGQFFGSFGKGLESLVDESPGLPAISDLEVGVAPEFDDPESAIPLDVIDSWLVGMGNDYIRPALNGPVTGTLDSVRDVLKSLREEIEKARSQEAPKLHQMQRLRRIAQLNARAKALLEKGSTSALLGEEDTGEFLSEASEAADEAMRVATEFLKNTPAGARFKVGFAAVRLYLQASVNSTLLGTDLGLDLGLTLTKLDQWTSAALEDYGYNLDGSVAEPSVVDGLAAADFRLVALVVLDLEAMKALMGGAATALPGQFARLEYEKVRDAYNVAVASGDLEARSVQSVRLLDLAALQGMIAFAATDVEKQLMVMAYQDTFETIAADGGGGQTRKKLAGAFLQAARRNVELDDRLVRKRKAEMFGETRGTKPEFASTLDFSFYDYSFWEKIAASVGALDDAGLLDAVAAGRIEANLASLFAFHREALVAEYADADLVTQDLEGAYDALLTMLDLLTLADELLPGDGALLGELQTSWQALHVTWLGVAEVQRAHWLIAAYTREIADAAARYGDGVAGALATALRVAGTEAAAGLGGVVDLMVAVVDSIDTEEFKVQLPGDIELQRAFGDLAFNRVTGDWSVGFGGRLAFPDINTSFEITAATLASDGEFDVSLMTDGPAPFGFEDSLRLDVSTAFSFTGNVLTPALNSASASGQLIWEPMPGGDPDIFDITLNYNFLTDPPPDRHRIEIEADFTGQRELFTNEIVIFDGGFGFNLEAEVDGTPTQGGLDTSITAGILLRPEAVGKPVDQLVIGDFWLQFVGDASIDFSVVGELAEFSMNSGSLTLPEDIFTNEAQNGPATVTLVDPVCVRYDFGTGELAFCDPGGQPTEILFENITADIPGVDGDLVELHSAALLLSGTELPVLTDLDATLTIPLPGDEPAVVGISDGDFRLDGFPSGTITLLSNVALYDNDGFTFTLLGDANGFCPEGTTLDVTRIEGGPDDGLARIEMNGALRFRVPPSVLHIDSPGDDPIEAVVCGGGFVLDPGVAPRILLDSITIDGLGSDYIFAGENGLRIANPYLRLDNIDQLWTPDGDGVFSITVNGQLAFDGVGAFGLKNAMFSFPAGQIPSFRLDGVNFRVGETFGLDIDFPTGAGFVHENGESFLEYGVIDINFTPDSPIQVIGELNFTDLGQNRRLPLDGLSFDDLLEALALEPGSGIGVKIYDYLTAIWYGGTLTDTGIIDAEFSLSSDELPLPDSRITIPVLSFERGEPVRFAFYGDFELDDNSPVPALVRVPPTRPVWIEVSPNSLRLSGRVEVFLEGGTTFAGELLMDDPFYQIKLEAGGISVPLADGLSDLLPANAANCLPATNDDAQLDVAAACLKPYAEAYANFTATVAGAAVVGADPDAAAPTEPPGAFGSALSVLEAWSWSALAPTAQALPLQNLADFFDFSCDATAGTQDCETVVRYLLALKRVKLGLEDGMLDGSPEEIQKLETAIADAEMAAIARAQDPEAVGSLASLEATISMLLKIEEIHAQLNETGNPALLGTHVPNLMRRGTRNYVASLGVIAGTFTPGSNPTIDEMNRFVAFSTVRDLLALMADAALLGVDDQVDAPVAEALTQLAIRFYTLNAEALDAAREAGDIRMFQYAMEDLLELESLRALAIFPDHPALDMLPDLADLATFAGQLSDMFLADLDRPHGDRTFRSHLVTLGGLLAILEEMPDGVTFVAQPFENAFDRMGAAINQAVGSLFAIDRCDELALLIEAGTIHARLADRFMLTRPYDWSGAGGHLELIVQRLVTVATAGKCWTQLYAASCQLIGESQNEANAAELVRRRAYLDNAVVVIDAARAVALDCWNDEDTRRAANPALGLADMVLPGDVLIDRVAGSARYNRRSGEFGGAFSGSMRLPKFDASLTLNNASFDSGGAFDLNAFGTITLPPGGNFATLAILERQPLHMSFEPPNDFSLTGGATLTMDNGMQFGAHLMIDDPEYAFGASMKGVRFDLADSLKVYVPTFPNNAEVFPEISGRILGRYFTSLGGTLETLVPVLDAPRIGDPGTPPEFVAPTLDDPLQPLELWTNSALKDIETGVNDSYAATYDFLREQVRLIALDLRELTREVKNLDAIATRTRALRRASELLKRMADETLLGGDPGHDQWAELRLVLDEALAAARCLMQVPGNQTNLWRANRSAEAVLDAAAADAAAGGNDLIVSELVTFYDGALTNVLADYGFAADGSLTNPAALEGRTRDELVDIIKVFLDSVTKLELMGGTRLDDVLATLQVLVFRQRDQIVRELRSVGDDDYGEHLKLARAYLDIPGFAGDGGLSYPAGGELVIGGNGPISEGADIDAAVDQIEAALDKQKRVERRLASNPNEKFLHDLADALKKADRQLRGDLKEFIDAQVEERANQLEQLISEDWPAGRIRDGLGMLEEMLEIMAWYEATQAGELVHIQDVVLPDLTVKFTAAAEAQKAWWLLGRYTEMLYDASAQKFGNDTTILANAFQAAASDTLRASKRLSDAMILLLPDLEPVEIALPGDLVIDSAFGEMFYNRETQFLQGTFGGRMSFPEANTFFEVVQLQVANDGSFSIDLTTGGEIPLGDTTQVNFDIPLLSGGGDLQGNFDFTGAGSLSLLDPNNPGNPTTVSVNASYSTATDLIDFESTLSNLAIVDDFAVLDGSIGAQISTASPDGAITVSGKIGLIARTTPLPTDRPLTETDFYLTLDIDDTTVTYSADELTATFTGGAVTLPPDIFSQTTNGELNGAPATIALGGSLCIAYNFSDGTLSFCDENNQPFAVTFNDIGFEVPGLPGSLVTIDDTELLLSGSDFPLLTQLNAGFVFPLPGNDASDMDQNDAVGFDLNVQTWRLDGFPEAASLSLVSDVRILDMDGFSLDVLAGQGAEIGGCPPGLSMMHDPATGETTFNLAGGMRAAIAGEILWDAEADEGLSAAALGCFSWKVGEFPIFTLDAITFGGRFRLGGPDGVEFKGADGAAEATITFSNVQNVFERPPAAISESFRIDLQGAVNFADIVEFALIESSFIWDGTVTNPITGQLDNILPRFEPGGVCAVVGEEGIDLIEGLLPLYPTELCLRFVDGALPLFPGAGEMGLFDPLNLIVDASGIISLPNGVAVDGGSPGISGGVAGVEIRFMEEPETGIPIPDFVSTIASVDSITLRLEGLDIPPLGGITGGIHLGNLDRAIAGFPEDIFFAGEVGATINDIGASVLLAAKPTEFVGACFSLNAGPAGIPLDGGTLGGILLTGGSGGINLKNSFSNPCDFESYINIGAGGEPMADFPAAGEAGRDDPNGGPPDVDELNEGIEDDLAANPVNTDPDIPPAPDCLLPTTPDFSCIQGPFPPPTINPLCERIFVGLPGQEEERIIFKGTSLDEAQVLDLLELAFPDTPRAQIRAHLDSIVPGEIIDAFVTQIVGSLQGTVDQIIGGDIDLDGMAEFDPATIDPRAHEFFASKINDLFNSADDSAKHVLREAFDRALKADPNSSLYDILLQKAAEGIRCFDVTVRLEGTLSHSAISSVLTGTGAVTLSSTGTAVLDGSINLIGIPVGTGTLAFSLTNQNGSIDPSFGGVAEVALGPLELGRMTMSLGCPGCYEAVLDGLMVWVATNALAFDGDVDAFLIQMMDCAAPRRHPITGEIVPRDIATNIDVHYLEMSDKERFAWMSSFLNIFQIVVDNTAKVLQGEQPDPLPVVVTQQTLEVFLNSFKSLLVQVLTQVNPRICFGGDIGPKIFGFPLTGGADSSFGGGLLYQRVTDMATGEDYQELVAQMQFSPSQLLASSVMGTYAYSFPTAVDQAQMGYSLRVPAFTEDNIETLLMNPAQFATDQVTTLVEDAVLSFGYQLQPLGYKLADGQGRMIMPRIGGHPLNPNRSKKNPADPDQTIGLAAWVNPDDLNDPAIPTRMELILAALSKGQLQNPLWRGTSQDLASLFSLPSSPCYQPSNSGCDLLTLQVAARIDPARLASMDLANDYFPHGGLLGGAELAFPNMIAKLPPTDRLAQLLTLPTDGTEFGAWAENAGILFGDPSDVENPNFDDPGYAYFTGTLCSGQMAFYLPAPNPPGFDWANGSVNDFISLVKTADFQGIIDRTIPAQLYPADQILLSGWLDAPILGLPVAQGSIDYDPNAGCFMLHTEIPETYDHDDNPSTAEVDSWLAKFVTGEIDIQIKSPGYLEGVDSAEDVPVGGAEDRLLQLGSELADLDLAAASTFITDIQATLPKASMEVKSGVQIPQELEQFMRASGGTELEVFAFSPAFDPNFGVDPGGLVTDHTPYGVAKRRGGFGLRGTFDIGFFPPAGQAIVIDGLVGSFALSPDANVGVFPSVTGNLMVDTVALPGLPTLTNGEIAFSNSPDNLGPYTAIEGHLTPFKFTLPVPGGTVDLLAFESLNTGGTIGGRFEVIRDDGIAGDVGTRLMVDPASATMPFLGQDVAIAVYGGTEGGKFTPFSFSSSAGEPWSATVCLHSANDGQISGPGDLTPPTLAICDPFAPAGSDCFLAFTPGTTICGTIRGTGLQTFSLELDIPSGFDAVFFPNQPTEVRHKFGGNGIFKLYVDSGGRFYVDFGSSTNIDIPGALTAGGRLEFGYNSLGNFPDIVSNVGSRSFGQVDIIDTKSLAVTLTNNGTALANVSVGTTPGIHFSANATGFSLAPGASRVVDVIFHPQDPVAINGSLIITSNNPDKPVITIPLSGQGIAAPRYFQSRDAIAFGDTVVNGTSKGTLTVGNEGSAPMQITGISDNSSRFTVTPTGALTLQPGDSQTYIVSFTPTSKNLTAGTLSVSTATLGSHTVALSGTGSDPRWVTLLDNQTAGSSATLNDINMLTTKRGFVVGDSGSFLETENGGRSWIPRIITSYDMNDIAVGKMINNTVLAEYHFEEPPGSLNFRDDGPNARHGSSASAAQTPLAGYIYTPPGGSPIEIGRVGSGVRFEGVDSETTGDYINLTTFDLPTSWAIAFWANIETTSGNRAFLGKHTSGGGNQFGFGIYGSTYRMFTGASVAWNVGTPATGWHHFVMNGTYSSSRNTTTMTLYVDGATQAGNTSHEFPGRIGQFGGGKPWTVGQEWDGTNNRSDFFKGSIDELYFFSSTLSSVERGYLRADGDTPTQRIVIAGSDGMVFQSLTQGRAWQQLSDQNVLGFRTRYGTSHDHDWYSAAIASNGKLLLAGARDGNRIVMLEDHDPGFNSSPAVPQDDEFGDVIFAGSAGTGVNEPIFALTENGGAAGGSSFGRLYNAPVINDAFFRHGTVDISGSINGIYGHTSGGYIAVGDNGAIVRDASSAGLPAVISHGLTTANLYGIDYDSGMTVELHAVGDSGTYMTSSNFGANWNLAADGLEGNMRAIDIEGSGSLYEAWAVGEDHRINYRPRSVPNGPLLTFFPGELKFGFLLTGQSKTLPLTVVNRGVKDLDVSNIAISGSGFTIAQATVDTIPPDGKVTLLVRYKPTTTSSNDSGELVLTTNEAGSPSFRARLSGRASGRDWQPIDLGVSGDVLDVIFTSASTGYAMVDLGSGVSSRVYRTSNGGTTWSNLSLGNFGTDRIRLSGMDFHGGGFTSRGYVCGHLETSTGKFVRGIALRTTNSGSGWAERSPAVQNLRFADVKAHQVNAEFAVICSASGSGSGDVWETANFGQSWTNHQKTPADFFNGNVVGLVENVVAGNNFSLVMASSGNKLFSKVWQNNWARLSTNGMTLDFPSRVFNPDQIIRDFRFYDDPNLNFLPDYGWLVGDRGLFWRFDPLAANGANWHPPTNAEVFGVTNLKKVSFHDNGQGWTVGDSKIFLSGDGGHSWDLHFDAGEQADIQAVMSFSDTAAWAGGAVGGRAMIWRYRSNSSGTLPVLSANDYQEFPAIDPGESVVQTVTIRNLGNRTLNIHDISIESDDPLQRFTLPQTLPSNLLVAGLHNIFVTFHGTPEPISVEALDPELFHRFEQGWTDTTYFDCSKNGFDGHAPTNADARPTIVQDEGRRDRCLRLDGNDYVDIDGPDDIDDNFSISCWVNPDVASNNQFFWGKHTSTGGSNLFLFGLHSNGYAFVLRNQVHVAAVGDQQTGWQHLVVTGERSGTSTNITIWRDGVVLSTALVPAIVGNISGHDWILGADRDTGGSVNQFLRGCLDDFAIFNRVLNEGEIQSLGNKSPAAGLHQARLVINSDSGNGERTVDLLAEVNRTSRMVVLNSSPQGMPITVDGTNYNTPVSFGVGDVAGSVREWCEGSLHTVTVPASHTVIADGGTDIEYRFTGWDSAASNTLTIEASQANSSYTASYIVSSVEEPPAVPAQNIAAPAGFDVAAMPGGEFNISQALIGTPKGPFIRFTGGNLSVPQLGASGFDMDGELFLSLTRMYGSLSSTGIQTSSVAGRRFLEIGDSNWQLDYTAGAHFTMKAHPPSVTLMGYGVAPEAEACIELDVANNLYGIVFRLSDDFKPVPSFIEFKQGEVALAYTGGTNFSLAMDGGMRILRLPDSAPSDWALDTNIDFVVNTPNFNYNLDSIFGAGDIFNVGPFALSGGDVSIAPSGSGITLQLSNVGFELYGDSLANVSGSVSSDSTLTLNGDIADANLAVPLLSNGRFYLKKRNGVSGAFNLRIKSLPTPEMELQLPAMKLGVSVGEWDEDVNIPQLSFDTTGAFDTGKLSLPSFDFDGIGLSSGGSRSKNYIRLKREADGDMYFKIRDAQTFLGCSGHVFKMKVDNNSVTGSYRGTFCVLDDDDAISMDFDSASDCQFSASALGFTIYFGSDCAGVKNNFTGVCILGTCP